MPSSPPAPTLPPVETVRTPRVAFEVARGDTWWKIAREAYGAATAARVAELRVANGDVPLVPGLRIWLPGWKAVRE